MKTTIRRCTIEDLNDLREISIATFTETFGAQNSSEDLNKHLEQAYSLAQLRSEMQEVDSAFYFIFCEEQLAGYLKLNTGTAQTEEIAENALEIERIYIRSSFKGQGLGKSLIAQAAACAKKAHCSQIWLGVWEDNENALKFYQKMGFTQIGAHPFYVGDDQQTDLIMSRKIC